MRFFSDFNDDCTSSNDDSFEDIDYVEASPPDSELVSLEEVKDDILREKLLNIYLLIAKIESLNDNPTPDCVLKSPSTFPIPVEDIDSFFKKSDTSLSYSDNSLPEFETFSDHTIFSSETSRNKIFDPGIFFEVQSMRFLSRDTFSISFICDPLSLVFDTLLPFSSENEEKVFNPGSLSSNEEKSPHLLSHRGFNPSKIIFDFSKSPMMIYGGDIPILDVLFLHLYPP
ncbi:hypothetical protein Tco_1015274 [Tanacetum coccineum]|uniref:Uncharacterized protein n=1 Tax=Tanacetum coccineum TaxID=301880 RepID=A0ABQ5FKW8_9ASTR